MTIHLKCNTRCAPPIHYDVMIFRGVEPRKYDVAEVQNDVNRYRNGTIVLREILEYSWENDTIWSYGVEQEHLVNDYPPTQAFLTMWEESS